MSLIKLVYTPKQGLVQQIGESPGLFLGNTPISYAHSIEAVASVTGSYTINKESFIIADATDDNINITLPVISNGRHLTVKKIDSTSNTVTMTPEGSSSETIDGGESVVITTQWTSISVQAISDNWYIR